MPQIEVSTSIWSDFKKILCFVFVWPPIPTALQAK